MYFLGSLFSFLIMVIPTSATTFIICIRGATESARLPRSTKMSSRSMTVSPLYLSDGLFFLPCSQTMSYNVSSDFPTVYNLALSGLTKGDLANLPCLTTLFSYSRATGVMLSDCPLHPASAVTAGSTVPLYVPGCYGEAIKNRGWARPKADQVYSPSLIAHGDPQHEKLVRTRAMYYYTYHAFVEYLYY